MSRKKQMRLMSMLQFLKNSVKTTIKIKNLKIEIKTIKITKIKKATFSNKKIIVKTKKEAESC
jgi:hypothetical protein